MCACLRQFFLRGGTPIKMREIVNTILEPFHDDHENDEKAYADKCTNTKVETTLGVALLLMDNMQVHCMASYFHPVAVAVESHDTKIDMRALTSTGEIRRYHQGQREASFHNCT